MSINNPRGLKRVGRFRASKPPLLVDCLAANPPYNLENYDFTGGWL